MSFPDAIRTAVSELMANLVAATEKQARSAWDLTAPDQRWRLEAVSNWSDIDDPESVACWVGDLHTPGADPTSPMAEAFDLITSLLLAGTDDEWEATAAAALAWQRAQS